MYKSKEFICEFCTNKFIARAKNRKFCSTVCAGKANILCKGRFKLNKLIVNNLYKCSKCKLEKTIDNFHKRKNRPNGLNYHCIQCTKNKYNTLYYQPIMTGNKICSKCNKEKLITEFFAQRINKDGRSAECKVCTNSRKVRNLHNNLNTRLKENCRNRIRGVLYGTIKAGRTEDLIGCDVDKLKLHLESKFTEGMTWQNYGKGGWHVDHIRPCSSFDLTNKDEQRKCFHYTNLQPLWEKENLRKGHKYA